MLKGNYQTVFNEFFLALNRVAMAGCCDYSIGSSSEIMRGIFGTASQLWLLHCSLRVHSLSCYQVQQL